MKNPRLTLVILFAMLLIITVSCGKKEEPQQQKKIVVVTTLFPLYGFAKNVAPEETEVTLLLPPGVEAHAYEPKPGDMAKISSARVFIYTGKYMEPWAQPLISGAGSKGLIVTDASRGIDLMETREGNHSHDGEKDPHKEKHHHGAYDPHIWLDLENAGKMVDNIAEGLSTADAGNKDLYRKRAGEYKEKLAALDKRFRETLTICKKKTIVHGGHFAFGYLAHRYGLEYVSAYEGSPNAEPTAKRIIALKKIMKEKDVRYVYFEELITPRVSEVIAKETGATLLKLHGAHNISKDELEKGATFISLMEDNLASLRTGLECK